MLIYELCVNVTINIMSIIISYDTLTLPQSLDNILHNVTIKMHISLYGNGSCQYTHTNTRKYKMTLPLPHSASSSICCVVCGVPPVS